MCLFVFISCVRCGLDVSKLFEFFWNSEFFSDLFWLQEKLLVEVINKNLDVVSNFFQLPFFLGELFVYSPESLLRPT